MNLILLLFLVSFSYLFAGDYGDVYGTHPASNAMGNAVVSTVNDSSSVFYNVAGLGKQNSGDIILGQIEQKKEEESPESKPTEEGSLWSRIKTGSFTYVPSYRTEKTPHEFTLQFHIVR